MFIQYLSTDPALYVVVLFTLVLSTVLHELGHVFSALQQGDETPRLLGRVTLDPLVHMGLSSLLTAALLGMVWGSTPVQPANFRSRFGDAFVSASGPLVNLLLAALSLSALGLWMNAHGQDAIHLPLDQRDNLHLFLFVFGWWNVALAIFNLMPVPPLDGSSVLGSFVPSFGRLARLPEAQPWGFAVMILVVMVTPLFAWAKAISVAFVRLFVT